MGVVVMCNCCILAHSHCKTLQEKLHECSGESHACFAWTTVTTDDYIFGEISVTAILDHHICQYSTVVLALYILYHPLRGRILVKYITVRITNLRMNTRSGQNTGQQITDSLPDRLVNPDQYSCRPLLPVESELIHQQDNTKSGNHERCITPVYTYGSVN